VHLSLWRKGYIIVKGGVIMTSAGAVTVYRTPTGDDWTKSFVNNIDWELLWREVDRNAVPGESREEETVRLKILLDSFP
jgi:hypothetical protein